MIPDILHSRRGHLNEARNVAIFLARKLRGDSLREIGHEYGMDRDSAVGSVVEGMKVLAARD
jgi:chromosomal replication initiation ATPase DnaA